MDIMPLITVAAELANEVWVAVKQAIDSRNADVLSAATATMADALAALKEMRAQVVADVDAAFAEAQAEINRKEGT
jgi:hypothetical protein